MAFSFESFLAISAGHFMAFSVEPEQHRISRCEQSFQGQDHTNYIMQSKAGKVRICHQFACDNIYDTAKYYACDNL